MTTKIFVPSDNAEHWKVLEAFMTGVRACGEPVTMHSVNEYEECDVAVVFGVGKKNVPCSYARGQVIENQHMLGHPALIIEKGYVNRDEYYACGWNGLNNRAQFRNNGSPPDRWNELGTTLKPWRRTGSTILVCGQVPSDASVQNTDIIKWCAETVRTLVREVPGKQIVFRPHPLARNRTPDMIGAKTSTRPLAEDLADAACVVTYNSNTGVDAIIEGIPLYVADEGAMAYDIASKELTSAFMPHPKIVEQWAHDLAYTQWTLAEMREGKPWLHLTRTGVEI